LVWASNNHHDELVRIMLAGGADPELKLSTGKTVKDYAMHLPDNEKLLKILSNPPTPFNPEYTFDNGEPLFEYDPLFNYKLSNLALNEVEAYTEEEISVIFFFFFFFFFLIFFFLFLFIYYFILNLLRTIYKFYYSNDKLY